MAIPPNRSFQDNWYKRTTFKSNGSVDLTTFPMTCTKVSSSSSKSPKVALRPRIKLWVYKGQVYGRQSGWIYPKKKPKVAPNTWRPPKQYSAVLIEGNVNSFYASERAVSASAINETYGNVPLSTDLTLPAFPGYDPGLGNSAVIKALGKLKDQKINLAVAFAERTETAELLVGALSGLAKAARSLSRGNMKGVARGLGLLGSPKAPTGSNFHQKWLELQYGWQPLYNDVYGAVSALHAADQNDAKRYVVAVKGKVEKTSTIYRNSYPLSSGNFAHSHSQATIRTFEGAFVRLDYYLDNPFLASLAQLGITNPAEVVWERVPFSFVVDWFIPIGNYLSSMDAALGYLFRGGSLTQIYRQQLNGGIYPMKDGSGYSGISSQGIVNSRSVRLNRTVYTTSPLPRVPAFKNPFPQGSTHIANAIALFASSLGRK